MFKKAIFSGPSIEPDTGQALSEYLLSVNQQSQAQAVQVFKTAPDGGRGIIISALFTQWRKRRQESRNPETELEYKWFIPMASSKPWACLNPPTSQSLPELFLVLHHLLALPTLSPYPASSTLLHSGQPELCDVSLPKLPSRSWHRALKILRAK